MRKTRIQLLEMQWTSEEKDFHVKSRKKQKDILSMVPSIVKSHFLKEYLKSYIKAYLEESTQYRIKADIITKEFMTNYIKRDLEEMMTGKKALLKDRLPKKPMLILYQHKTQMRQLVDKAEKSRLKWDKIIKAESKSKSIIQIGSKIDRAPEEIIIVREEDQQFADKITNDSFAALKPDENGIPYDQSTSSHIKTPKPGQKPKRKSKTKTTQKNKKTG